MFDIHYLLAILLLLVIAFLIVRSIVLWYWKIDKIVNLLEKINFNLEENKPTDKKILDL